MKLHRFRRFAAIFLTVLLLLSSLGTTAFAYGDIDTGREASLTVFFGESGEGFSGGTFHIYRVADVSASIRFSLTGDFANYPVNVNGLDSSGWRALAQTLDGYVARDALTALQSKETGQDGKAVFDHLTPGLYLVTGDRYQQGYYTYTPEPFLICLPTLDEKTDTWIYDVVCSPKYGSDYDPPSGGGSDTVRRKVLKVWEDEEHQDQRPEAITVQLLRDGQIYDTVTLNDGNNWRYTWSNLDPSHVWHVVEYETPEGYTVSVEREGITFVMTNTYNEDLPDDPTPGGDLPDPPDQGIPDEPLPEGNVPPTDENVPPSEEDVPPSEDVPSDDPTLPQTGMLWWPVPLLAGGGLALFLIGWRKRRNEKP